MIISLCLHVFGVDILLYRKRKQSNSHVLHVESFSYGDAKNVEISGGLINALNAVLRDHRVVLMNEVVASMKIYPEDIVRDMGKLKETIKEAIPQGASLYRVDEEPIAFGLVALIVHVVLPESSSGELEKIEEAIRKVKGISEVETLIVRRI